jgi:hypothetical protein
MLHCDHREFDGLVEALAVACLRCRDPGGLLVQPNNIMRLEAVASAMLTVLLGSTVECEGTVHLTGFQATGRF